MKPAGEANDVPGHHGHVQWPVANGSGSSTVRFSSTGAARGAIVVTGRACVAVSVLSTLAGISADVGAALRLNARFISSSRAESWLLVGMPKLKTDSWDSGILRVDRSRHLCISRCRGATQKPWRDQITGVQRVTIEYHRCYIAATPSLFPFGR